LERKFPDFKEILENANMLCHGMQPNALLIWRGFINAKKWVLQSINYPFPTPTHSTGLALGGNIITKQVILSIPLNLAGKLYNASLIVLDGQGIDVILKMSWMTEHKALLETAARIVQLSTPDRALLPSNNHHLPL
jgi:hypothetical protein